MNTKTDIEDPRQIEHRSLFLLTKHWKSDLAFIGDELSILDSLNNKLYKIITKETNIKHNRAVASGITKLQRLQRLLTTEVSAHLHHLTMAEHRPFTIDYQTYRDEHEKVEAQFASLVKSFRQIRKKVYSLIDEQFFLPFD